MMMRLLVPRAHLRTLGLYGFQPVRSATNRSSGLNHVIAASPVLWHRAPADLRGVNVRGPAPPPDIRFMFFHMMFAVIPRFALIAARCPPSEGRAGVCSRSLVHLVLPRGPLGLGGGWIGSPGLRRLRVLPRVHINAGDAALGVHAVLRQRIGWPRENMRPHNVRSSLGAGLLWFGWFVSTPVPS